MRLRESHARVAEHPHVDRHEVIRGDACAAARGLDDPHRERATDRALDLDVDAELLRIDGEVVKVHHRAERAVHALYEHEVAPLRYDLSLAHLPLNRVGQSELVFDVPKRARHNGPLAA